MGITSMLVLLHSRVKVQDKCILIYINICIQYVCSQQLHTKKGANACILCFPSPHTDIHAVDREARPKHQPIRSLPLPALQGSSYRQASSSDICNIYIYPVMRQITTVTFRVWGTMTQWNQSQKKYMRSEEAEITQYWIQYQQTTGEWFQSLQCLHMKSCLTISNITEDVFLLMFHALWFITCGIINYLIKTLLINSKLIYSVAVNNSEM